MATRARPTPQAVPATGTMTERYHEHDEEPEAGPSEPVPTAGVLRLRGGPTVRQCVDGSGRHGLTAPRAVTWDEDTAIDNEHMGKKKSKSPSRRHRAAHLAVCCIYHKPRPFDESSSSSSGSSDEDSDAEGPPPRRPDEPLSDGAERGEGDEGEHVHGPGCRGRRHGKKRRHRPNGANVAEPSDRPAPNAYEVQPTPASKPDKGASVPTQV